MREIPRLFLGPETDYTEHFCGFPQSMQEDSRMVPQVRPLPLLFHSLSKPFFLNRPIVRHCVVGAAVREATAASFGPQTEVYRAFTQSLQGSVGTVPQIASRSLPSISFAIGCSLTTPLFDGMHSEQLTASLNKLQVFS
jgi:hypothetical protein